MDVDCKKGYDPVPDQFRQHTHPIIKYFGQCCEETWIHSSVAVLYNRQRTTDEGRERFRSARLIHE